MIRAKLRIEKWEGNCAGCDKLTPYMMQVYNPGSPSRDTKQLAGFPICEACFANLTRNMALQVMGMQAEKIG